MKVTIVALVLALGTPALAKNYLCAEKAAEARKGRRLQYGVKVATPGGITDPKVVGDYDHAKRVEVSVFSRDPNGSHPFRLDRPAFRAIAKSADVHYHIDARRTHGFHLDMYLDEMDQTSMELKGVRGDIRMSCKYGE